MKSRICKAFLYIIYILLYIPILVMMLYSFNDAKYSLLWKGFSFKWYVELLDDAHLWIAFIHSLVLGVLSSLIATTMALMTCLHFFIDHHAKKERLFSLLLFLIIIPDIVLGVAFLIFFNVTPFNLGFFSLLISHITFSLPFAIITIQATFQTLDANLYDSALDLGANKKTAFQKVLLPMLWPALLSAFLLCFTLSFDDVLISYFVAGPDFSILPLTIFSLVKTGITPELNALCALTLFVTMILVSIAYWFSRRRP